MASSVQNQNRNDTIINIPHQQTPLTTNNKKNVPTWLRTATCVVKTTAYSFCISGVVFGIVYYSSPDYAYIAMDIALVVSLVANALKQSEENKVCGCKN